MVSRRNVAGDEFLSKSVCEILHCKFDKKIFAPGACIDEFSNGKKI
jgi:hypothetical protein